MGEIITLESFLKIKKEEYQNNEVIRLIVENYLKLKKPMILEKAKKIIEENKEEEYKELLKEISLIEKKCEELEIFENFDIGETNITKDKYINYLTQKLCDLFHIKNPYPLFVLYVLSSIPQTYKEIENLLVFFVGRSGLGKSELLRFLDGLDHKLKIPRLTANTLVSGSKDVEDLAPTLKNKVVISQEFAEFLSMDADVKREIWGQLRDLTDGIAGKHAGTGKRKTYEGITPFVWIFNTTRVIQNEILFQQVLGSRYLLFDFDLFEIFNEQEVEQTILNESENELIERRKKAQEIFKEIVSYIIFVKQYFNSKIFNEDFIKEIVELVIQLRAEVPTDWQTGELTGKYDFYVENKKRLLKQIKLITENLQLFAYEEDIKKIIKWIAMSNIDYTRYEVLKLLENTDVGNGYKTRDIARDLNRSYKLIFRTLCLLQGAGLVNFSELEEYERYGVKAREWYITDKGRKVLEMLEDKKKIETLADLGRI